MGSLVVLLRLIVLSKDNDDEGPLFGAAGNNGCDDDDYGTDVHIGIDISSFLGSKLGN